MDRYEFKSKGVMAAVAGRLAATVSSLAFVMPLASALAADDPEARPVQLRALDGSAVIKGDLLEVDDGSYVIKTVLGTMRIGIEEAACEGAGCPGLEQVEGDFSITGRVDDEGQLVPRLVASYAANLGADYQLNPSDDGAQDVSILDGGGRLLKAAVATRDAVGTEGDATAGTKADIKLFAAPGLADIETRDELLLGFDGVAVIIHPENPVGSLSLQTLAELFACSKTDWQGIGEASGPVRLYAGGAGSVASGTFEALVLEPYGLALCDQASRVQASDELVNQVMADVNAIGFVSLADARRAKTVAINGCDLRQSPSFFNVKTGEYPIARRIFLDAPSLSESSASLQKFVDFALSDNGQRELGDAGLIGLDVATTNGFTLDYRLTKVESAAKVVQQSAMINKLVEETENAVRLSATFRFRSSSAALGEINVLDNRGQRDLLRLARYLKDEADDDAELLLLGFADGSGDYDTNMTLSEQRAQSIADKLAELGVETSVVAGFGEEAPIACNEEPQGRALNRRVEAWLRS